MNEPAKPKRNCQMGETIVLRAAMVISSLVLAAGAVAAYSHQGQFFATLDQQGQRLLDAGQSAEAGKTFADPERRAAALFDAGEFKAAEKGFSALPTAEGAYNQGTSLMMMGKYEDAVKRFDRALEMRPGWEEAKQNRVIAAGRAERLKKKGGLGTGGQLGADDVVFGNDPPGNDDESEEVTLDGKGTAQDATLQSMWLRQVQTTPATFLRMKFAYQQSMREQPTEATAEDAEQP